MYLIALEGQPGYDTVYWTPSSRTLHAGDFVVTDQGECLALGEEIAFPELYVPQNIPQLHEIQQRIPHFLDDRILQGMHRLAHTYYAAYKHVIGLFPLKTPYRAWKPAPTNGTTMSQQCILFPDLWSLTQGIPVKEQIEAHKKEGSIAILHGGLTVTQKRTIYERVRTGEITTLYATSRGLFLPWNNLGEIIIHSSQAWAYSNQSEPRYSILQVAAEWSKIYDAKLTVY